MLVKPSKRGLHSRGKMSPLEPLFVNVPSNFVQTFRIDFQSVRRNFRSDLHEGFSIRGAKLHLFETLFVNMPSNFFKISESISNGFEEMLGQTFKKKSP